MGNPDDRDHFDDYREQTRVKHEILAAYLQPYFRIVGKGSESLLYIDGFAGRGTYQIATTGEPQDGSPLRALKLIAANDTFAKKVRTAFIECDNELFARMQLAVEAFAKNEKHIHKPWTFHGTFAAGVAELLRQTQGSLPPTFLFVDPCGVSGTSFETIKSVMARKSSEAFIFFNIDGVRRIAGLDKLSHVLVELLGSQQRAEGLFRRLQTVRRVSERERTILASYRDALHEDMGVKFTIPFRVESEDKQKTSHYLIHATNHSLGFKIMKEIMWTRGHSKQGEGSLQFVQASRTDYIPLFDPRHDLKQEILKALASGPKCVNLFYDDWVVRPADLLCQPAYRQALLELEANGGIDVLDKDGITPQAARKAEAAQWQADAWQ